MTVQVAVLNGGSSSGKTTLGHALQQVLPGEWVAFGVDTLGDAVPGIDVGAGGEVAVGEGFTRIEAAWLAGLAAMVRAGARLVYDDVFLGGATSQARVRHAFDGLDVLWVGVHRDAAVATAREAARGDREAGMAGLQAMAVHDGVTYDVEVDTGVGSPEECAHRIAAVVKARMSSVDLHERPLRLDHGAGAC